MLLKKRDLIFLGLIVVSLVLFGLISFNSKNKEKTGSEVTKESQIEEGVYEGETPPDFVLKDLKGEEVSLRRYRGKVVLLNFWATWCPPCRKEMPSMVKLYDRYKDKNLGIVAVNLDKMDKSGVEKFGLEYNLNFPVLLDPLGRVAVQYGVVALPFTFILDRKGRIRERVAGRQDWTSEENLKKFETLLDEVE